MHSHVLLIVFRWRFHTDTSTDTWLWRISYLKLLYLHSRRHTRAVSFRPDVSTLEEAVKTSSCNPHVWYEESSRVDCERIEVLPQSTSSISQGRFKLLVFASHLVYLGSRVRFPMEPHGHKYAWKSGEDIMIILDCIPAITEPASWQPKLVPRSQFSEHVKEMHRERDRGFKSEFLVCFH